MSKVLNPCQLQLDLRMPWNGVDPRYLTRAAKAFRLAPEGTSWPDRGRAQAGPNNDPKDPLQLELDLWDIG